MVENINDFLSIALLVGFFVLLLYVGFEILNKNRIRKHIEEEYYYYNDFEDNEDSDDHEDQSEI